MNLALVVSLAFVALALWHVRMQCSAFARLDTLLYSPLCLLLAIGVALVAGRHGA